MNLNPTAKNSRFRAETPEPEPPAEIVRVPRASAPISMPGTDSNEIYAPVGGLTTKVW